MARQPWNHKRSKLTTALGRHHHGVGDPIVKSGESVEVVGKFAYGPTSKDLQDERVTLLLGDAPSPCPKWRVVAAGLTDDDGRITLTVPDPPKAPGRHPFALVVDADGSFTSGSIWVLSPGQRVVVFDVDGTLTHGDEALLEQLVSGVSPPARSGSKAVAHRLAAGGALIVYITGRLDILSGLTREWLSKRGFPLGPLRTTREVDAALPTEEGVQAFKLATLKELQERGALIERVYGNAPTDICAYAKAGIPPAQTFIVGSHAGEACDGGAPTQAIESYDAHLTTLP